MSVTQIGSDTMPKVNLDGKRYRLCDVYKYFDVSDSTVRKRYKEGLRGPELIHGKEYINMVQTYERNEKQLTAKQLYEIQQAEIRHERALKRKRREERIARAKRSEREVAKHRVNTRYFKNLVQNNLMVKVKTDQYGNVQRGSGMKLHELNPGDDIWFKYPKAKTSFPAVVEELNYNFNGEPYLMVRVGSELVKIDDRYDIVKV